MEAKYKIGDIVARRYTHDGSLGFPQRVVDIFYSQSSKSYCYETDLSNIYLERKLVGVINFEVEESDE